MKLTVVPTLRSTTVVDGATVTAVTTVRTVQVVDDAVKVITAAIPGRDGANGAAGGSYTFNQVGASTTWTITHNLGYNPSVTTVDTNAHVIEGDVRYDSVNQVTVLFASAVAGVAYLS